MTIKKTLTGSEAEKILKRTETKTDDFVVPSMKYILNDDLRKSRYN